MRKYLFLLIIILASCGILKEVETKNHTYTLKGKEVRSFNKSLKAYNLNEQGSRVFSLHKFPTKDSISVDIRYLEGKTDTIKGETIYVNCDSIAKENGGKAGVVSKPCPPSTHRVDTLIKDSIITVTDNREITALSKEVDNHKQDKLKAENKANLWQKTGIAFMALFLLMVVLLIIKNR